MAFDAKRINPIDRLPRKAVGIDIPFSGQGVFNSTYQTKDSIKVNLINYLLTEKGERPLNPSFGSNIRQLLFQNINEEELEVVEETIKTDILRVFPNIVLTELNVFSNTDSNLIEIFFKYAIKDQNVQDELLITLN